MSTDYYRLKKPISSIRVQEDGQHTRLTIFCNGANTGTLCLRSGGEANDFLRAMQDRADDNFLVTYYAGAERGTQIQMCDEDLDPRDLRPEMQLVSEYGELTTIGELLAKVGPRAKTETATLPR